MIQTWSRLDTHQVSMQPKTTQHFFIYFKNKHFYFIEKLNICKRERRRIHKHKEHIIDIKMMIHIYAK